MIIKYLTLQVILHNQFWSGYTCTINCCCCLFSSYGISYGQFHQVVTPFYINDWPLACVVLRPLAPSCACALAKPLLFHMLAPLLQSWDGSLSRTFLSWSVWLQFHSTHYRFLNLFVCRSVALSQLLAIDIYLQQY